jgi:hypothetical protein
MLPFFPRPRRRATRCPTGLIGSLAAARRPGAAPPATVRRVRPAGRAGVARTRPGGLPVRRLPSAVRVRRVKAIVLEPLVDRRMGADARIKTAGHFALMRGRARRVLTHGHLAPHRFFDDYHPRRARELALFGPRAPRLAAARAAERPHAATDRARRRSHARSASAGLDAARSPPSIGATCGPRTRSIALRDRQAPHTRHGAPAQRPPHSAWRFKLLKTAEGAGAGSTGTSWSPSSSPARIHRRIRVPDEHATHDEGHRLTVFHAHLIHSS